MEYLRGLFILILLSAPVLLPAQETQNDSLFVFQQVEDLIAQGQYASAHLLLKDYLEHVGEKPFFVCLMVENGLKHFYDHDNYQIFYLRDSEVQWNHKLLDTLNNVRTARLRYPQRILKRLIQTHPNLAKPYQLLGYYYELQYNDLSDIDIIPMNRIQMLEKEIYRNYRKAFQLGSRDVSVVRWLGDYFYRNNQVDQAEKYYRLNIKKPHQDAISYLRLAEIYVHRKMYTEAYQYAMTALKLFPATEVYLRYDAIRLAARVLKELGELDKYVYYLKECIRILPDVQDAYLDLIDYYLWDEKYDQAEETFRQMLLNNPFDLQGYKALVKYVLKTGHYLFASKLFDEMLLKFENSDEVMANVYRFKGNLAYFQDMPEEAKKFWELSRNYLKRYLPPHSPLIREVGDIKALENLKAEKQ